MSFNHFQLFIGITDTSSPRPVPKLTYMELKMDLIQNKLTSTQKKLYNANRALKRVRRKKITSQLRHGKRWDKVLPELVDSQNMTKDLINKTPLAIHSLCNEATWKKISVFPYEMKFYFE